MSFALRLLLLSLIVIVFEFYFFRKLFNAFRHVLPNFSLKNKWALRAIIFYLNLFVILYVTNLIITISTGGGIRQIPENFFFDYLILYPFWIFILIVIQSVLILLPVDILKLLSSPLWKNGKELIRKISFRFTFLLILCSSLYVPARVIWDLNSVAVRVTEYDLPGIDTDLSLILIADIQADWYTDTDRLNNYIEKVNQSKPDLVLVAGDIITSTPNYIEAGAEALSKIKSKHGVFSCVGDHDNWAYRSEVRRSRTAVSEALRQRGIRMLDNENITLSIDSLNIFITAVTETYSDRISESMLDSLTNDSTPCDLKIFLTHQPVQQLIDRAVEKNYNLFLAGHTHGGQITFLFPFRNLSVTHFETNLVKGDFRFGEMMMIINRGLGMSLSPVRYNSTPEVTVLKIR